MKDNFKMIVKSYVIGFLTSAFIVLVFMLVDFIASDYLRYPEFSNFLFTCSIAGIGWGITWYIYFYNLKINN